MDRIYGKNRNRAMPLMVRRGSLIGNSSLKLSGLGVSIFLVCSGCIEMEVVPSDVFIERRLGEFLISPDELEGVYQNRDVDSLIFTYRSGIEMEETFVAELESAVAGNEWMRSDGVTGIIEYRRSSVKGDSSEGDSEPPTFTSFEVVRVSFNPSDRFVVVAYVRSDSGRNHLSFEDSHRLGHAEKYIWPRFDGLRRGGSSDDG